MEKAKEDATFIAGEKELIELKGFADPVLGSQTRKFHAKVMQGGKSVMKEFPQWGRDGAAALGLIVEYGLCPKSDAEQTTVTYEMPAGGSDSVTAFAKDHTDSVAALRMALLQAAIKKQWSLNQQ
jgi:hypothetical protein